MTHSYPAAFSAFAKTLYAAGFGRYKHLPRVDSKAALASGLEWSERLKFLCSEIEAVRSPAASTPPMLAFSSIALEICSLGPASGVQ
jgi:hypothetical protein